MKRDLLLVALSFGAGACMVAAVDYPNCAFIGFVLSLAVGVLLRTRTL